MGEKPANLGLCRHGIAKFIFISGAKKMKLQDFELGFRCVIESRWTVTR